MRGPTSRRTSTASVRPCFHVDSAVFLVVACARLTARRDLAWILFRANGAIRSQGHLESRSTSCTTRQQVLVRAAALVSPVYLISPIGMAYSHGSHQVRAMRAESAVGPVAARSSSPLPTYLSTQDLMTATKTMQVRFLKADLSVEAVPGRRDTSCWWCREPS
ncbi:hypothetical protein OH77DRAFT_491842 [Trametes cingulata]|nr:hypothetical protein OH77DRAFT_491842 [Trametes cingulata]